MLKCASFAEGVMAVTGCPVMHVDSSFMQFYVKQDYYTAAI